MPYGSDDYICIILNLCVSIKELSNEKDNRRGILLIWMSNDRIWTYISSVCQPWCLKWMLKGCFGVWHRSIECQFVSGLS